MTHNIRPESDIFSDLATICSKPGFAHVIAAICFRDNVIGIKDEIDAKTIAGQFRDNRLIRTEISTLIGLWFRSGCSVDIVSQRTISELAIRTEQILEELHTVIGRPLIDEISTAKPASNKNPFLKGEVLREPIFYGGDSAYGFQYRDFSKLKYASDNEWLIKNRNIDVSLAVNIVSIIGEFQNENLKRHLLTLKNANQSTWTMLPGFAFSAAEIAENSAYTPDQVRFVIEAFSPPLETGNSQFSKIGDFNIVNAYPIIRIESEKYLLFHYYTLFEALYENPFFWMIADKNYKEIAAKNRGEFLEKFAYERLKTVFGTSKVYRNVKLEIPGKKDAGEIDVLVIFAGRVLLIQAKTKRLTIEARKGNDLAIAADFKASIQDAYD
ncbi:nuclease-related domain-containing protein [Methylobacterium haplocladii]|uniref:NERD domain-containing protein n=1 Tax=Methylobacterium haplocladii TaxID=1176176 RepID=A0A512IQ25_9HYPH|nr:nuclease-related domain-containing protein [Methylobacterium haplocladii]GEO99821.1 hypothetical protein MHA02_22090 [Methylobacterium haplocladii]GJD84798.1 hypothetical protein HPGCJGGD_2681 [Methylobacterium haplocladii]GLS59712.1 hypothetical protein GCM10007887_23820 [Methylobacterium haplocladii]